MPISSASLSPVQVLESELAAAGKGLVDNTDVLRSVLSGCGDCIKILDLEGRLQFMSEGGKRVMEVDDFSALKGCPWPDFWQDDGNIAAKKAVALAQSGQTGRFKGAALTAKGTPRYWDVQVSPIFDPQGKISHLLSISRDITEEHRATLGLREALERQAVLAGELQHRIKNTLAMIGAIANQTIRGGDVAAARAAFMARLITLGAAHDILTQSSWTNAPVRDVAIAALAPHRTGQGQFHIDGPPFTLQAKPALALALAIHELATNAVKYGSLSRDGTITIEWSIDAAEPKMFHFRWVESGGPPVVAPSIDKKGFGSRLIEKLCASDFNGTVQTFFRPTGFECELTAPVNGIAG